MRKYIENIVLPDNLLHLNKGDEAHHKIKDTKFNRRLLNLEVVVNTNNYLHNIPKYLAAYQIDAVIKCVENKRWGLFMSPGSGKTNVLCESLKIFTENFSHESYNICVIAPKTLHDMWKKKLEDICKVKFVVRSTGKYSIQNIEYFLKNASPNSDYSNTVFIYDESGVVVSKNSKRYKELKLIFGKDNYAKLIFSTGSPFSNKICDMWPQLNLLYPSEFSSYWDFAKIFHYVEIDRYGWKILDQYENAEHLLRRCLLDYCTLDKLEDHVVLPKQTSYILNVSMNEYQKEIYQQLESNLFSDKDTEIFVNSKLDLLIKLKKISSDLSLLGLPVENTEKLNSLYRILDTVEYPCVVFGTFNATLKRIADHKSGLYFASDGEPPDRFLRGEVNLLVSQIKSGKFGFSFNNVKTVIFYDYNFDADDLWQAKHRVRRYDSTEEVKIVYMVSSPIDDVMLEMNLSRNNSLTKLLGTYKERIHVNGNKAS